LTEDGNEGYKQIFELAELNTLWYMLMRIDFILFERADECV